MSDEPSREADLHLAVDAFWARWCSMAGLESVDEHKVRVALEAVVRAFAVAGRLLPEGTRSRGMCGAEAPTLFGAGLDLQVCELLAGHPGWHGRPNAPGEPWMNWTDRMVVHAERDEETDKP